MPSYEERLERFIEKAGPLCHAECPPDDRRTVLDELLALAAADDWPASCRTPEGGYVPHCLHDDPAGWSLTMIVLAHGGATPIHDHPSWGAAATVSGVERNLRYKDPGRHVLVDEQVAPPGGGYLFGRRDIHKAVDGTGDVTVSVHLLVDSGPHDVEVLPS